MNSLKKIRENISQKLKNFRINFKNRREKINDKKVYSRIERLENTIFKEMPELSNMGLDEKVKRYYEIRGIEAQKNNNTLMSLLTIVIIILTFLQFLLLVRQTGLMDKQTELMSTSTVPFEPELRIWSKYSPIELSTQFLMNHKGQRERVEICIKNIGQTNTGHIYYHWQNNWTHNYNSNNVHPGIESGDAICDWLELTADDCFGDLEGCTKDIIPEGWIDLNLSINCDYCIPRETIKTFRACIWQGDSSICRA